MGKIDERLNDLGLILPKASIPSAVYVPVRQTGNLVYTSGFKKM